LLPCSRYILQPQIEALELTKLSSSNAVGRGGGPKPTILQSLKCLGSLKSNKPLRNNDVKHFKQVIILSFLMTIVGKARDVDLRLKRSQVTT